MKTLPRIQCDLNIPGWRIHFCQMKLRKDRERGQVMELAMKGIHSRTTRRFAETPLEKEGHILALRAELSNLGITTDLPLNSESILQWVLAQDSPPAGNLAYEFLLMLICNSLAPWSLISADLASTPFSLRLGKKGEILTGCDGDIACEGLPVLEQKGAVLCSPFSANDPGCVDNDQDPLYVCYMPDALASKINAKAHLGRAVWMTWAYEFVQEKSFRFKFAS